MPGTPGNRKQRYILDIDDVVKDGFMTKANAEALIRGINGSSGVVKLSVPFGGTNNATFVDQEVLKYDAASGKIVSAGFTGVLPGGNSVFIPRETGTIYTDLGVDKMTKSGVEMVIASQNFDLPANSQWSDLMVTFQFAMNDVNPSVTGLEVRLGDDATPPVGFVQPPKTLLYQVGASPDNVAVTWLAMGHIPLARSFDTTLNVNLYGAPQDLPSYRSVITRASYRGLQPEPAAGGQKGIPIFLDPEYVIFYSPGGVPVIPWTTVDISPYVPETASAVLMSFHVRSNEQGSGGAIQVRRQLGSPVYTVVTAVTNNDEDDLDSDISMFILPFAQTAGVRTIDYQITWPFNAGAFVKLMGYIT